MRTVCCVLLMASAMGCGVRRHDPLTRDRTARVPVPRTETAATPPPPSPPVIRDNFPIEKNVATAATPERRELNAILVQLNASLLDLFFGYDRADLDPRSLEAVRANAGLVKPILAEFEGVQLIVEGHCDERGSAEYNLALGDRRASRAADALVEFGVDRARLQTISYGKEAPQCTDATESCYQRNRRAHFSVKSADPAVVTQR